MQVDLIVQKKDTCLIQYDEHDQFCAGNVYKRKDTCNVNDLFLRGLKANTINLKRFS